MKNASSTSGTRRPCPLSTPCLCWQMRFGTVGGVSPGWMRPQLSQPLPLFRHPDSVRKESSASRVSPWSCELRRLTSFEHQQKIDKSCKIHGVFFGHHLDLLSTVNWWSALIFLCLLMLCASHVRKSFRTVALVIQGDLRCFSTFLCSYYWSKCWI